MEFVGEHVIPAPIETVWNGLNDPDVLRRSIPGCTELQKTGDTEFTATVVIRVGPVAATFKGKVELADLDPPNGYTLKGRGQGGPAGFAKGSAQIRLVPQSDQTKLTYTANVDIGGKLASVGGRLIQTVAKNNAEAFFTSFSNVLTGVETGVAEIAPEKARPAEAAPPSYMPLLDRLAWLVAGIGIGVIATLVLT